MPHWVTIDGNHVLLDEQGNSLSDPSIGGHRRSRKAAPKKQHETDSFGKSKPDSYADLKSKLDRLPENKQKSVLREILSVSFQKQIEGINESGLKNDFQSAEKALQHYVEGSGVPLKMSFNEINTSRIKPSHFPKIRQTLSGPPRDETIEITDKEVFFPFGAHAAFLGDCKFKLQGKLKLSKNGTWSFNGSLKAFDQLYDFNKSSHRGPVGELLTWVGSKIPGKPYNIEIRGEKPISESGEMGYRKSNKSIRWFY